MLKILFVLTERTAVKSFSLIIIKQRNLENVYTVVLSITEYSAEVLLAKANAKTMMIIQRIKRIGR